MSEEYNYNVADRLNNLEQRIYQRYDPIKLVIDENSDAIYTAKTVVHPMLANILKSLPFRIMNYFYHWYYPVIVKNCSYIKETYEVMIVLYNEDTDFIMDWKFYYREYKENCKKLKKEGVDLKTLRWYI